MSAHRTPAPHPAPSRVRRWLAHERARQWLTSGIGIAELGLFQLIVGSPQEAASAVAWLVAWFGSFQLTSAVAYAVLTLVAFHGLRGEALRTFARETATRRRRRWWRIEDEVGLAMTSAAVAAVVVAALLIDRTVRQEPYASPAALAAVAGAWVMMLLGYATRYLRAWAVDESVDFPDERSEVEFSDFVFLAVQVSTAYAPEVAALRTAAVRRTATAHNILAFVFNTVIVALLVIVALPVVV